MLNFFLANWYLFLLAVVSGALLFLPTLIKGGFSDISPAQAVQKINHEKARVVDVRSNEEFSKAHIKGAKHVPLDKVEQELPNLFKNKTSPIIFICATSFRARRGAGVAKKLGFENSQVVAGGMKAWLEAGLPTVQTSKG